jgi:hypothetical protein
VRQLIYSKLEQLANEYIDDVNRACSVMLEGLNLKSKEEMLKHRNVQGRGEFYIKGVNRYTFHGRGCRFSSNNLEIDWDFGYDNIWCGLDPWKLFYYIRDNKTVNEFKDGDQIKEAFDELITKRKMIKKFDLYYLL